VKFVDESLGCVGTDIPMLEILQGAANPAQVGLTISLSQFPIVVFCHDDIGGFVVLEHMHWPVLQGFVNYRESSALDFSRWDRLLHCVCCGSHEVTVSQLSHHGKLSDAADEILIILLDATLSFDRWRE
jgi:hypothetical protein